MDNKTEGSRLVWRFGAFAGLPAGVLLFLAYRFAYDADIAYFRTGSVLFATACLLCAAGVLSSIALWGFMRHRYSFDRKPDTGRAETFAALFAAVLFAAALIRFALASASAGRLAILSTACLVFPAAYLLCTGLAPEKTAGAAPWLAFGGALSAIMQMFNRYFEISLPLNAPTRHLETLAAVGMLLFFLSEARIHIGTGYATVAFYAFANGCAAVLCTAVGLAHAVHILTGGIFVPGNPSNPFWDAALFALGMLALCRLLRLPGLLGPYRAPYVTENDGKKRKNGNGANENENAAGSDGSSNENHTQEV